MLFIAVVLINCKTDQIDNDIEVYATNHSVQKIDSLKVYSIDGISISDSITLKEVNIDSSIHTTWKDIQLNNVDGTFLAVSYSNGKILNKPFGYYTNGINLYKSISIIVYTDSLVVSKSLKDL